MSLTAGEQMIEELRRHRPLLLACEAIGWLHMAGKAHSDFLRCHGSAGVSYNEKEWFRGLDPDWSSRLAWLTSAFPSPGWTWPGTLTEFLDRYDDGSSRPSAVGLLQAGHAMASGIEKQSYPPRTVEYLGQDVTHMWIATAFGHPIRNLLANPPPILGPDGWAQFIEHVGALLDELQRLGTSPPPDADPWWRWRSTAIGDEGWLRQVFTSTLAETRLPNNDVTLWDQSYVAAALLKSAAAGLVLSPAANWQNLNLKSQTRWRVLTVAFGSRHYEARAVRIGDWAGARQQIESFFDEVCRLVEVELAVGSLLYRDHEALAFTFPGERFDSAAGGSLDSAGAEVLRSEIESLIDGLARDRRFETPPLCHVSASTRSFIPMAAELKTARSEVAIPIHRSWTIEPSDETRGHVCPVCRLRFNGDSGGKRVNVSKQRPCKVCRDRRKGRLDAWLASGTDTIWISEVADENDRVALLTLSFDLDPWLDGTRVDSLRAQSIADWRRFNATLGNQDNPIPRDAPYRRLVDHIEQLVQQPMQAAQSDAVMRSLQAGFQHEQDWATFYEKVVRDRSDAPAWNDARINERTRALWLAHQLFRKNASPGRTYRFWRTAEAFFAELLPRFREMASSNPNRWGTRRLVLSADGGGQQQWEDRETYAGRYRDAPFEVLYRASSNDFVTICNLARMLDEHESSASLQEGLRNEPLKLTGDDGEERILTPASVQDAPGLGAYAPIIVLDHTPARFRVLVPLSAANACIDAALRKWEEEFARVWDRMPLRVGVVAFPRMTPFQAVIEAARSVEDQLGDGDAERWRVVEARTRDGVTSLSLARPDGVRELAAIPSRLPDGRGDAFYPFLRVQDATVRHPRDFATPGGTVYRHVMDLQPGDGVEVASSRVALQFMDSTAVRFEPVRVSHLTDWRRLRDIWALLEREAPSMTALRAAWGVLATTKETWRTPAGPAEATTEAWSELARSVLAERLGVRGAALDALAEAAASGVLEQTLEWHLRALKEPLEERP